MRDFLKIYGFNTQPPEGGWVLDLKIHLVIAVSTHSRLKAAGVYPLFILV